MTFYTASGARRTGDEYQDLQSAEVLIEWLEQPDAYRWVRLETMDGSLDDIQAERADGARRLLQVKFGINADAEWDWEDFLKQESGRKGPKRSLLQKWKTSLDDAKASGTTIGEAALVTNRAASTSIRAHLSDSGLINFDELPTALRDGISTQIEGAAAASAFFASFHFYFRERSFETLEAGLRTRFHRLGGSEEGWTNLIRNIRRWINRQDEPAPDGTITLADVRTAALWHLPPQIPQGFLVPDDYVAPRAWSDGTVEPLLRNGGDNLVMVTGSPGAGKSTYLSWLVEQFRSAEASPVVRHHYFLSTTDETPYRTGWETAADAIIGQVRSLYGDLVQTADGRNPLPETLREHLVAAGRGREGSDPLVVIVDGLDHVWRDTGSEEGLRRLFDLLLPVPDGVVLVVGTQDIDLARIPQKLRDLCPRDRWLEVPVLDGEGVHEWLQHHEHELGLPETQEHAGRVLGELSDAFHEVSGGHPLVMHYTLSAARQEGSPIRPDRVHALPSFDPTSNVATYYRALWESISPEGHHLLHLLAGFQWAWPRDGLVQCLAPQADPARLELAERAIRHVLGSSHAGVTAFHESLLAFVRSLPDHRDTARALKPQVIDWLAHRAPEHWRWRHEWEERARGGDAEPLISSATLDWCVDSLAEGRGRTEIAGVVAASGWTALAEGRLGVATERHYIDEYLDEAEHSEGVLSKLLWLGLHDRDPRSRELELGLFLSRKARASDEEIEAASEVAFTEGRLDLSCELLQECRERWNAIVRRSEGLGGTFSSLEQSIPSVIAASLNNPSEGPYQRYVSEHADDPRWCSRERYTKALARHCVVGSDTRAGREELRFLANRTDQVSLQAVSEIVRLAWRDGFDPDGWIEDPQARRSGLFRCDQLWVRRGTRTSTDGTREVSFRSVSLTGYYEGESMFVELSPSYFFACLANAAEGCPPAEATGLEEDAHDIEAFLFTLRDLACEAAHCREQGQTIGAAWLLDRLATMDASEAKLNDLANRFVRPEPVARIVVAIAQDLEELQRAQTGQVTLTADAIAKAVEGPWTRARNWIEDRVERRLTFSASDVVRLLIDRERYRLESSKDYLHTRAEEYASLAQFCQLHQIAVDETRYLARLGARNLMGHGFRKDTVLFDVLRAIRVASESSKTRTLARLRAISPVVQVVDEITDGAETRHLKRELAEVVNEVAPEALPPYLRALQRNHDHWQVETCYTDFARSAPIETVYEKALASTLVHEEALSALQERANGGDTNAGSVRAKTLVNFGRQAADEKEPETSSSTLARDIEESPPPVKDYPPERLAEFVRAVRDAHIYGDEHLATWTAHWRTRNPDGLLAALTRYRVANGYPHEKQTAKAVVELALERSGLSAAWEWLVAYHDAFYGWTRHAYRLTDVRWIWEFVGARFRERWLEFIKETSRPLWGAAGGAPSWSAQRMIAFLETVGRAGRADEVVEAAVCWGAGLAADMRLPEAALTPDGPELPPALRLLVDRLDCPSRMVQERASWSLAELLADTETRDSTTKALLDWHAAEPLELRSCLLLVMLHLARTTHGISAVTCVDLARRANLVPSIGAEILLREFGDRGADLAASLGYRTRHSRRPPINSSGVKDFGSTVRAHLAPVFLRFASMLDTSGIPFSRQWEWEAVELSRQQELLLEPNAHFDYHYRGGADGPAMAINDRVSVVLRSAYLRALHWSVDEAALDVGRAETHARWLAVMADPTLWAVRPWVRPAWWPTDPGEADRLDILGEAVGRAVMDRLEEQASEEEILLFTAGPIGNRPHLRAEVTIRAFLQSAQGAMKPSQRDLAKVPQVKCHPVPPRLFLPGTYASSMQYAGLLRDWMIAPLAWELFPNTQQWLLPEHQTRGIHVPATWLFLEEPVITTESGRVSFSSGAQQVARYSYWNDELRDRYYPGAGSRVGAELLMRREWLEPQLEAGATLCWVATLSIAQREEYKEQFGEPRVVGTWVVGGSHIVWPEPWLPPPSD